MEIERQILDEDGSLRDINVDNIDASKACDLIGHFLKDYSLYNVYSSSLDGDLEDKALLKVAKKINLRFKLFEGEGEGKAVLLWKNEKALIKHFQIYFDWFEFDDISVELTFSPEDIDVDRFSMNVFIDFLRPIINVTGTKKVFARYENVNWEYGDVDQYSGVIFYSLDAGKL